MPTHRSLCAGKNHPAGYGFLTASRLLDRRSQPTALLCCAPTPHHEPTALDLSRVSTSCQTTKPAAVALPLARIWPIPQSQGHLIHAANPQDRDAVGVFLGYPPYCRLRQKADQQTHMPRAPAGQKIGPFLDASRQERTVQPWFARHWLSLVGTLLRQLLPHPKLHEASRPPENLPCLG